MWKVPAREFEAPSEGFSACDTGIVDELVISFLLFFLRSGERTGSSVACAMVS